MGCICVCDVGAPYLCIYAKNSQNRHAFVTTIVKGAGFVQENDQ